MSKFIVKWQVTKQEPAQCPDYKPDPYTGDYPLMQCLVYHTKTVTKNMEKVFDTREEVDAFIVGSPAYLKDKMEVGQFL